MIAGGSIAEHAIAGEPDVAGGAPAYSGAAASAAGVRASQTGQKSASAAAAARSDVRSTASGQSTINPQGVAYSRIGARCTASGSKGAAASQSAVLGVRGAAAGVKAASSIWDARAGVRSTAAGQAAAVVQVVASARLGARCTASGTKFAAATAAASAAVRAAGAGSKATAAGAQARTGVRSPALGQVGVLPQGVTAARAGVRCSASGGKSAQAGAHARCGVRCRVTGQIVAELAYLSASVHCPVISRSRPANLSTVTLAEAKAHCRVDHSDEDAWFGIAIAAATAKAEHELGRALITQTWEAVYDAFPAGGIELGRPTVQSIVSVKYLDGTGTEQTISSTGYVLDPDMLPGFVLPAAASAWPSAADAVNAVRVRFVQGWSSASNPQRAQLDSDAHWHRLPQPGNGSAGRQHQRAAQPLR